MQSINTILDDLYDAWRHQDLTWLASYLPADFSHVILIPEDIHPLGGVRQGNREALDRLARIVADYEFEQFDTSGLLAAKTRAAVEIPLLATAKAGRAWKRASSASGPSRPAGLSN